jgi:hypothetical protein
MDTIDNDEVLHSNERKQSPSKRPNTEMSPTKPLDSGRSLQSRRSLAEFNMSSDKRMSEFDQDVLFLIQNLR